MGIIFGICSAIVSVLVYAFSTFATIRYVHTYVDSRHAEILRHLDDLSESVEKMDKRLWERSNEIQT